MQEWVQQHKQHTSSYWGHYVIITRQTAAVAMLRQKNLVKHCGTEQVFGEKYLLVPHSVGFTVPSIINVQLKFKDGPWRASLASPPWNDALRLYWHFRWIFPVTSTIPGFFLFLPWAQKEGRNQRQKLSRSTSQGNGSPCKMMLSSTKPYFKTGCHH